MVDSRVRLADGASLRYRIRGAGQPLLLIRPLGGSIAGTPFPRRASMRFIVCPPIVARGDPDDPAAILSLRNATRDAIDSALAESR